MNTTARRAKPVSEATRRLLDEMKADAAAPKSEDKLEKVRDGIRRLRELELEKATLEARVKEASAQINEIKNKTLVDLLDEAEINGLSIPANGNLPPYTVGLEDYYHANIPEENQQQAYAWMKKTKNEDMIKTTYVVSFGLGEAKDATRFEKALNKLGEPYDKKQGVPWNTLTAFIRGEYEAGRPLNAKVRGMLGATVGRVAKVIKQKEKK